MNNIQCNIDKTDRINRIVIGAVIALAALFGMGWWFFVIVGLILIVEGIVGWCAIPHLMGKLKKR